MSYFLRIFPVNKSCMVDGFLAPDVLPVMIWIWCPKTLRHCLTVFAAWCPLWFALVETKAIPVSLHSLAVNGWLLTRIAILVCLPVSHLGQCLAAGTIQVWGFLALPHDCCMICIWDGLRGEINFSRWLKQSATKIKPLCWGLPFNLKIFCTAFRLAGSQPSPNTASVG